MGLTFRCTGLGATGSAYFRSRRHWWLLPASELSVSTLRYEERTLQIRVRVVVALFVCDIRAHIIVVQHRDRSRRSRWYGDPVRDRAFAGSWLTRAGGYTERCALRARASAPGWVELCYVRCVILSRPG